MPGLATRRPLPLLLLIDDDMVSREVMATVLTMSGYTVHTAPGGDAALEQLSSGDCAPGAILMDAQMPGLSGIQLMEGLRAHSSAPVYAMSGSQAPDEVLAAADGFLLKPFSPDALHALLTEDAEKAQQAGKAEHAGKAQHASEARNSVATQRQAQDSPSDPPRAEPVVDAKILAQLRELMSDAAVREIYVALVADILSRLAPLQAAFANGDREQVRRIGHSIKGGCGIAGALQAARLGALLESTRIEPAGNQLDNSAALLHDLRAAAHNLQRMLELEFPAGESPN